MKLVLTLVILVVMTTIGVAQAGNYLGAGFSITKSTNEVPNGNTYPGFYFEGGITLPKSLQARLLLEASNEAQLPTIFTGDNNPVRKAESELRFRPEVRYYGRWAYKVRPFAAAGMEFYKQSFNVESVGPEFGMNALVGGGLGYGNHEVSYNRILTDYSVFNKSKLSGNRFGYSYVHLLTDRLALKAAGELDAVSFRETYGFKGGDYYREYDVIFKARFGVVIQ